MPATRFKSSGGAVWIDQSTSANAQATPLYFCKSWTLEGSSDQIEVTSFGDASKTYLTGLPDAKGSIEGYQDSTATTGSTWLFAASTLGTARKLYLYPTTPSASGPYYYGTANISVSYDNAVDGAASMSIQWSAFTSFYPVG